MGTCKNTPKSRKIEKVIMAGGWKNNNNNVSLKTV